jgi:hypothetical protein
MLLVWETDVLAENLLAVSLCRATNSAWFGQGFHTDHIGDISQDQNCPSFCPAITVDIAFMGIIQDSSILFSANW